MEIIKYGDSISHIFGFDRRVLVKEKIEDLKRNLILKNKLNIY